MTGPVDLDSAIREQEKSRRTPDHSRPKPNGDGRHLDGPEDNAPFYRMADLRAELASPESERRQIWITEHADDCDALANLGVLATTWNHRLGGWTDAHTRDLAGTDVILFFAAGRQAEAARLASRLAGVVGRLQVISLSACWPQAEPGHGARAWLETGNGSASRLYGILDGLPDWRPDPYRSQFGAVPWSDLDKERAPYSWLIDNILPAHERTIIYGEPQSGKSFWTADLCLSIARGAPWFGLKPKRCGVIYCAFEGGKGFPNRINGYRVHHNLPTDDGTPFVCLTHSATLYGNPEELNRMAEEFRHWGDVLSKSGWPVGVIAIDTVSASSTGIDENAGKDFGKYLSNIRDLARPLNAATLLVHHKPKTGESTPRGSGKLTGDLEAAIDVYADPHGEHDDLGRPIRIAKITKQREADRGKEFRFVLAQVVIGYTDVGSPITTCVVMPMDSSNAAAQDRRRGYSLNPSEASFFRALQKALDRYGTFHPNIREIPDGRPAVAYDEVKRMYADMNPWDGADGSGGRGEEMHRNKLKSQLRRCRERLSDPNGANVIGVYQNLVWWSGRPVRGFQNTFPAPERRPQAASSPLPEDIGDLV